MEILSVRLKNFKVHGDRYFQFHPGTNAICGENGAGKTSILEAIAWTLFNYRGNYRKEDLVRNGCRSAQATVSFISNKDARTYNIQRCTSKGYTVFDPQLDQRLPYNRIDDEVLPWLREHLGVMAGTDLARLFENTIGVPQGMLTADFLLSGEKRRRVFDTVLKVEEYKQTASGLGSLQKYADGQVEALRRDIGHYENSLRDRADVETQATALHHDIQASQAQMADLEQQLIQLQQQKDTIAVQVNALQTLEQQIQSLKAQMVGRQREHQLLEEAVARSQQAVQRCDQHQSGHDHYLKATEELNQLQTQRQAHLKLLHRRQALDQQTAAIEQTLATVTEKLHQVALAEDQMTALQPLIAQQEDLEAQRQQLETQLNQMQQWDVERDALSTQLQRLRNDWKILSQTIKRIESYEVQIATIPALEQQRERLQSQLSRIDVAQQFEAELTEIVTQATLEAHRHDQEVQGAIAHLQPFLTITARDRTVDDQNRVKLEAVIAVLTAGTELTTPLVTQLQQILADLATQVSTSDLKRQQLDIHQQLTQLYQHQGEWERLGEQQSALATIQAEGQHTQAHIDQLTTQLGEQTTTQSTLTQVCQDLQALNDPRQQCQFLQQQLAQKPDLLAQQETLTRQQQSSQQTLADLQEQLAQFQELETQIQAQQKQQQYHHESYLTVLQSQQVASQLQAHQAALAQSEADMTALNQQHSTLQRDYDAAVALHDPQAWQAVETAYTDVRTQRDRIHGSLPQQQRFLAELEKRRADLQDTALKRDRAHVELTHKTHNQDFIAFARSAYKQAGPRITERYVQAISKEADRLFRELLNRQNVALEWTRDYEIVVQEGPHVRRFINLSGGEQMCAALAVRLALLRVLADIDIAFFDEPTTNMDRARRESLAEAIANLKTFRQLFVISHDDTFEQFTEHVVPVQRAP